VRTFASLGAMLAALGVQLVARRRGGQWEGRARRPACGCADDHRHSPIGCLAVGCNCKAVRP
jgi:hypothetical protein